jgi:hypothetical protein
LGVINKKIYGFNLVFNISSFVSEFSGIRSNPEAHQSLSRREEVPMFELRKIFYRSRQTQSSYGQVSFRTNTKAIIFNSNIERCTSELIINVYVNYQIAEFNAKITCVMTRKNALA